MLSFLQVCVLSGLSKEHTDSDVHSDAFKNYFIVGFYVLRESQIGFQIL
jgi:hypothetical protein